MAGKKREEMMEQISELKRKMKEWKVEEGKEERERGGGGGKTGK